MNPASNASPAPVVSIAAIGRVATSNRAGQAASDQDADAVGAALDDHDRGQRERALLGLRPGARDRPELGRGRQQQVRLDLANAAPRGGLPVGQERADRRQVQADQRPGGARQRDGGPPGLPERLAEERVDG